GGIAVAVDAPLHAERLDHPHHLHLVHAPVAFHAAHALGHVLRVAEIGVVGDAVDAHPLDGLAGPDGLAHRLEERRVVPNDGVAVHARLGGGNGRVRPLLHGRVAVPAVEPEVTHV